MNKKTYIIFRARRNEWYFDGTQVPVDETIVRTSNPEYLLKKFSKMDCGLYGKYSGTIYEIENPNEDSDKWIKKQIEIYDLERKINFENWKRRSNFYE